MCIYTSSCEYVGVGALYLGVGMTVWSVYPLSLSSCLFWCDNWLPPSCLPALASQLGLRRAPFTPVLGEGSELLPFLQS